MKLRALINFLRRTERQLGRYGYNADVHIGLNGYHGNLHGVDLRNLEAVAPDVFLRAAKRDDGKAIVP